MQFRLATAVRSRGTCVTDAVTGSNALIGRWTMTGGRYIGPTTALADYVGTTTLCAYVDRSDAIFGPETLDDNPFWQRSPELALRDVVGCRSDPALTVAGGVAIKIGARGAQRTVKVYGERGSGSRSLGAVARR